MSEIVLTAGEQTQLAACEAVIDKGIKIFVTVGLALAEIREKRLYRGQWSTFEEYCDVRWGFKRSYAYEIMEAATTVKTIEMSGIPDIGSPINVAQARPLAGLEPEKQIEVWQEAKASAPNGKVTAAHVEAIVAQHRTPPPLPTPTPQRTLEASVPAFTPPVIEPEPRRPATPPSRQLSDEEAHAVVWRVLERQCDVGKAIAPKSLQMQRDWLVKADWSLFHDALATGVRFANGQLLQNLNLVKSELEQKIAHFTVNFVEKPQPAPPIVEPEEEPEKDKDENYTPPYIVEAAREVLGEIDLDPASCALAQKVVKAKTYLTKVFDSLRPQVPWLGRVWLNPPFSNPAPFTHKLIDQYEIRNIEAAILLVNNGTETQWGQALLRHPYPVCFVGAHKGGRSRIDFWQSDPDEPRTGNRYAQMIFYLGLKTDRFREVFSQFGVIR